MTDFKKSNLERFLLISLIWLITSIILLITKDSSKFIYTTLFILSFITTTVCIASIKKNK